MVRRTVCPDVRPPEVNILRRAKVRYKEEERPSEIAKRCAGISPHFRVRNKYVCCGTSAGTADWVVALYQALRSSYTPCGVGCCTGRCGCMSLAWPWIS